MFLTENYVEKNEVSADPVYAMQLMQEATDDWNDICMKMIKLEHTAIMKEDAELLAEGAREALTRFKNNIVVLGRKLIEYLEKVRVQWTKLQASISSKFVNTQAVSELYSKYKAKASKGKLRVVLPTNYKDIFTVVQSMASATGKVVDVIIKDDKITSMKYTSQDAFDKESRSNKGFSDTDDSLQDKVDKILEGYKFEEYVEEKPVDIDSTLIKGALDFLKQRPVAIKNIEIMKKAVTNVQNAAISEMEKDDRPQARNNLVVLQRAFNKMIIKINKSTTYAVKICNAVKETSGYTGIDKKDKSKAYESRSGVYKVKNESVLDLF